MKHEFAFLMLMILPLGNEVFCQDSRPSSDSRPTTTSEVTVHANGTTVDAESTARIVGKGELVQNCADQAADKSSSTGMTCVGQASDIKSSPSKAGSEWRTAGSALCKITCTSNKPGLADPLLEGLHE